ncbi:MAG TPA: transposase, partial [Clostridiales bacterium]|nr:transposase [Clostridiales bacterium]
MLVNRVEQHQIKKTHSMFKIVDELCFKSKNLYNYANYIIRQEFIINHNYINYYDMKKELKTHEPFKDLGSQASQQVLEKLDKNWKSFFVAIKDWTKYPNKYLGRPRIPKYKKKDGRNIVILSNIQFKIENALVKFSWKPFRKFKIPTRVQGKLMQIRFVPKTSHYIMEIVYQIDVPEVTIESKNIVGIDIGIDNFATISNNIGVQPIIINGRDVKSINQYYNKKKAELQSDVKVRYNQDWSNRLQRLTDKRNNKIDYF